MYLYIPTAVEHWWNEGYTSINQQGDTSIGSKITGQKTNFMGYKKVIGTSIVPDDTEVCVLGIRVSRT